MEAASKISKTSKDSKAKTLNNKRPAITMMSQHPSVKLAMQDKLKNSNLHVGRADDSFEKEADHVANFIVSKPDSYFQSNLAVSGISSHTHDTVNTHSDNTNISNTTINIQRSCEQCADEIQLKREDDSDADFQQRLEPSKRLADNIYQIKQGGKPLDNQNYFSSRFGYDFDNVRIHNNPDDHQLADSLGARAFTYGNHIVFADRQYSPGTQRGKRLLAHELTHVVQQGAVSQNQTNNQNQISLKRSHNTPQLQAEETTPPETATDELIVPDVAGNKSSGRVDRSNPATATITWSQITIPRFKNRDHRRSRYQALLPLKRGKGQTVDRTGENNPVQRDKWLRDVDKTNIRSGLEQRLRTANAGELPEGNRHVFEVRNSNQQNRYYYGSLDSLATEFLIPTWGGKGRRASPNFYHVDHIVELQLANWPHSTQGNDLENMELLEGRRNQDSGRIIRDAILAKINGFISATDSAYGSTPQEIKQNFTLVFEGVRGSGGPSVRREDYWKRSEIENADHLNSVAAADPTKIGGPGLVRIFSRPNGGVSHAFRWSGNTSEEQTVPSSLASERYWLKPFVITHKYFKTEPENETEGNDFGYLRMHVSQRNPVFKSKDPIDIQLNRFVGARYGGSLPETVRSTINSLNANFFSPITFDQVDIFGDRGIVATGNIDVSLPFFSDSTQIGIRLEDGDLEVFKEFSIEDINVPAPFDVNECTLMLSYSLRDGWGAQGNVNFGIENVGTGQVSVGLAQETGFSAAGQFDFDSTLFNPARLMVGYANDAWSFSGIVGIQDGLIPGINSAELNIGWANNVLSGSGQVAFSYPWLESGTMNFSSSEDDFSLAASVGLTGEVPGLRSGTVGMQVSKNAEGIWSLGGTINANLDTDRVPGFTNAVLTGQIQDGIFDASVEAAFERNLASGTVLVGVTNQALDEEGQPRPGERTEELVFYGSGDLTLQLTPWLAASAGISFDRQGSISIVGGVEVTEDIEILTDEQTPDFEVPRSRRPGFDVNIPLLSVGVADVALDLAGELNAYLRTSPLILTDVRLNVYYEFDDPQATRVEGNARLHMDAQAGLEGILELGLSARILVLRGGGKIALTIGAELDGDIDLTVQPEWNLIEGFSVDADLDAVVQPVIFVSLDGYLYAEIDLLLGSIDVWESERLNLADKRLPLDVQLGATARAHYREKPQSRLTYTGITWVIPTADDMKNALIKLVEDEV